MTATFSRFIGFAFLILFLIGFVGSCETGSIEGLALAELFAFIGLGYMCYAKKLETGYVFCSGN